jgi:predicted nucleic acid-binding protein
VKSVLHTSVVIAPHIGPLDGELSVSAATFAELHYGVLVANDPEVRAERLRRLTVLQRTFDPLPVDDLVACSYGQIAAAVVAKGGSSPTRVKDLLIAATAHAHGARLYTRNAADLLGLEELVEVIAV